MKLSDLGLNRWGYKSVQQTETTDSSNMSSDTPIYKVQTEQIKTTPSEGGDAKNVQPGTVIKDCIIIAKELTTDTLTLVNYYTGEPLAVFGQLGLDSTIIMVTNDLGYEFSPWGFITWFYNESEPAPTDINLGTDTRPWGTVYTLNVGDASNKSTLYGSVVACPLPTVPNALDIIRKIPEPTTVGERGHYGDGLYFDDETFPDEVLWEVNGKKELEHTKMIGLLMKAVTELTQKVDDLEKRLHY